MKKTKHCLTTEEWQCVIHSLNALKTKLHSEGKYTDTVDETLYKIMNAKNKRVEVTG